MLLDFIIMTGSWHLQSLVGNNLVYVISGWCFKIGCFFPSRLLFFQLCSLHHLHIKTCVQVEFRRLRFLILLELQHADRVVKLPWINNTIVHVEYGLLLIANAFLRRVQRTDIEGLLHGRTDRSTTGPGNWCLPQLTRRRYLNVSCVLLLLWGQVLIINELAFSATLVRVEFLSPSHAANVAVHSFIMFPLLLLDQMVPPL